MEMSRLLSHLIDDLRYGQRRLRKNAWSSAPSVLVLALGIGAGTAVFSVVDGVLLRPLEYHDPDRIVTFTSVFPMKGTRAPVVSLPDLMDWRAGTSTFSATTYYRKSRRAVIANEAAYFAQVVRTSPDFFTVLGVEPMMGRAFLPDEDAANGTIIISYDFWRNQMGGREILGQTLRLDNRTMTIAGVMPPGFAYPEATSLWHLTDAVNKEYQEPRATIAWTGLARLKSRATVEQTQAQLTPIAERLEQQYPASNVGRRVEVAKLKDSIVMNARPTLFILLAAVGVVLLIACANVATMLLGGAASRTAEIATRVALGASRGRIVSQLLTENLLLALVAGCLGVLVGAVGSRTLLTMAPPDIPRLSEVSVSTRVLLFTLTISALTTLVFGLAPALQTSRLALSDRLKRGATRSAGAGRLSRILVVAEIALCVVLVTTAGLLIRSFIALNTVDLGFNPDHVLVTDLSVPGAPSAGALFYRELLEDLAHTPGVVGAGAGLGMPGHVASGGSYWIDHRPDDATIDPFAGVYSIVTPGTLTALGIPLKRGRDFTAGDTNGARKVALINETLAKKEFGSQDPIGRTIIAGYDMEGPMTIVGVVGDSRQYSPSLSPIPEVLMPYEQHVRASGTALRLMVRTIGSPDAFESLLRTKVRARSTSVPMSFTTMQHSLADFSAVPRFRTMLVSGFGLIALCLAVAGVYGVVTFMVGQRTREIGLRMALGATKGAILRMVIGEGALLAAIGMVLGVGAAAAMARLINSMLFQVKPDDPLTIFAGLASLSALTFAACYLPASRAAGIDPFRTLRVE